MFLKLLPFPTKSEQDTFCFLPVETYMATWGNKVLTVLILKFDYRYTTKVSKHAFVSLKLPFVLNVNKTYNIVLLLSENTDFLLVHVRFGKGLKLYL